MYCYPQYWEDLQHPFELVNSVTFTALIPNLLIYSVCSRSSADEQEVHLEN
jgi:hypothetical protein